MPDADLGHAHASPSSLPLSYLLDAADRIAETGGQ
jgi:hypothetical protein